MFKKNKSGKLSVKDKISLSVYILLKKYPYQNITISQICEKAKVSRMSFYRYYTSKDDIFVDYCDEKFEQCYDIIENMENPTLESFLLIVFSFIKKSAKEIESLKSVGLHYLLLRQFDSYLKYIASHTKSDTFKETLKNKVSSPFIAGGIFMVMMTWVDNHYQESVEELTKLTLEVLTINN